MFSQGDEGKSWYIIMKGSVNVVIYGKVGRNIVTSFYVIGLRQMLMLKKIVKNDGSALSLFKYIFLENFVNM